MAAGHLLQMGTPTAVYERPRTPFVARFLGAANLLRGRDLGFDTPLVMLRPEHGILGSADGWNWTGRVTSVSFFGADQQVEVTCDNGVILRVRVRSTERVQPGQAVSVGIPKRHVWPIPDTDPPELAATVAGTIGPQPPSPPV
jgi:ABC-type Fe3+/spermidine/putrescine transport system ATPase subunit